MAKRKPIQQIKSGVLKLIAKAQDGKIKGKTVQFSCGDCLAVAVNKGTGLAKWVARCHGKIIMLGEYGEMEYKVASEKVAKIKKESLEELELTSKCPTVSDYFQIYLKHWLSTHKQGTHRRHTLTSLMNTTLYPLHNYRLNQLTRKLIIEKINSTNQTQNNKHNAAALLNQMLCYAHNNALIDSNPIETMLQNSNSPFPTAKKTHHASVHYNDFIEKVVQPLTEANGYSRAVYLMLFLTGFRFGECRLLRWSWIDCETMSIMIPAEAEGSNKTKHTLIKPLTEPMKDLLQCIAMMNSRKTDFVFQSLMKDDPKAISDSVIREPWRQFVKSEVSHIHGVRSTIRSWIKEQKKQDPVTGYMTPVYSFEAAEGALTHDTRDSLEKSYDNSNRIEPVREVLTAWDNWLVERLPKEFSDLLLKGKKNPIDWNKGTFLNQMDER